MKKKRIKVKKERKVENNNTRLINIFSIHEDTYHRVSQVHLSLRET